jgi:DNA-binding transcriptional ArsR family regulator
MDAVSDAESQAQICGVFSNSKRIHILWALANGELSVSDIAEEVDASLQNTSHHLRLMKDKGILASRRSGRSVRYRIVEPVTVNCLLNKAPDSMRQHLVDEPSDGRT